ncbi:pyridine nucleotide-disulfide oxidoreductase [delta proteobacterium NaphS2]|nr:pyridine nucleotide-disulfide oxidoreductase [delta proteobacterium NaphS2]
MTKPVCPVADTIERLSQIIAGGRLEPARCRQRAEEILKLMEDVSSGRGGPEHIPAMALLASALEEEGPDDACRKTGAMLTSVLAEHHEVFKSHLDTQICPVTDCARLIPSPCQMACPAGIDVPSYVTLIGQGRDAEAIALIRKDNPFPWVCGLICTNPCEFMCVRGRIDKPVSIKYLKGFAAERAMSDGLYKNPEKAPSKNQKVCIIGAGPAGMSAAFFLALKGYGVTVLDALPVAGGMMMVGIPRYRLPREVIDREVSMIEELGVEFRLNTRLGKDVQFEGLQAEGFGAFLIAIGAHDSHKLGIKGEGEYPQVVDAVSYLRRVSLGDRRKPGQRVAVLGGGNVAIDAARTSLRLGCQEVTIIYRRSRSDMPANEEEVEQAEEERVCFSFLTVPVEIVGENGKVTALRCVRTELGPEDQSGRRRPVPIEGSDFEFRVDAVISSIGQRVDPKGLESLEHMAWTRRNTIKTNSISMETTVPGVFAAGDAVVGPATVVEAIGGGKRAADAIDRYLSGIPQPKMRTVPVRRNRLDFIEVPASTKMTLQRPQMPMLNDERRRVTFQQVELGFTENAVREEARRCLRCDVCIRCGACVDICRNKMGVDALQFGYLNFDHREPTDFRVTAERCILCGACAANCPTEAISMADVGEERILNLCGTVLNRLKVERCQVCGKVVGPERYHDYITRRMKGITPKSQKGVLCLDCARETSARRHAEMAPPKLTV